VKQEKDDLRAKFEEDREQIQREKDQLLVEHIGFIEIVTLMQTPPLQSPLTSWSSDLSLFPESK